MDILYIYIYIEREREKEREKYMSYIYNYTMLCYIISIYTILDVVVVYYVVCFGKGLFRSPSAEPGML